MLNLKHYPWERGKKKQVEYHNRRASYLLIYLDLIKSANLAT